MSRSFTPPDSLSKDEIKTIANVRREIWTSSWQGMAVGAFGSLGAHQLVSWTKVTSKPLTRNTAFLSFMLGGAMGSFLAATVTGKNQVHKLHPIYQVGAKPPTAYQESLQRAITARKEESTRAMSIRMRERRATLNTADGDSLKDRQNNRVLRRKTLHNRLLGGAQSLNDQGKSDKHF